MTQEGDIATHTIKFIDGSHAQVTYKDGQAGEVTSYRVVHSINNEGEFYFTIKKPNEE